MWNAEASEVSTAYCTALRWTMLSKRCAMLSGDTKA